MTPSAERSLRILAELTSIRSRRHRSLELIVSDNPSTTFGSNTTLDPSWAFWIPPAFRDSLDVRLTTRVLDNMQAMLLTQGGSFNFETGCVLYDTKSAYVDTWGTALHSIGRCLQVKEASPAVDATRGSKRDPGFVLVAVLEPDETHERLVETRRLTMTQDRFVELLITGIEPATPDT